MQTTSEHEARSAAVEEIVKKARSMQPGLRERAHRTETERRLPAETVSELRESGLLRILQPARFGGLELGFHGVNQVIYELGQACGSTAWTVLILNTGSLVAAFPEQAQIDVWGQSADAPCGAVFAPATGVKKVDGGFRIRGEWTIGSGSDLAEWFAVCGMVEGNPMDMRFFLVPRSDYTVEETWFTTGLRGTSSNTIRVDGAFVPEHRNLEFTAAREGKGPGSGLHQSAFYRIPLAATFSVGGAAPAVGIALGAVALWEEETRERVVYGQPVASTPAAQMRLAEATAAIDCARMLVDRDTDYAEQVVAAGGELSLEDRARAQRDAAYAGRLCVRAVDLAFEASGAHGIYDSHPIQRAWRDVHAVAAHIALRWDSAAQHFGSVRFGRGPANPVFF